MAEQPLDLTALEALAGVTVRREEPVARHGNLRIGGPVDVFVVVHREASLVAVWRGLRGVGLQPRSLVGFTDIYAAEEGLGGALVRLGRDFSEVRILGETVWVGAAAPLARVGVLASEAGLVDWAPLARHAGTLAAWMVESGPERFIPFVRRFKVLSGGRVRDWEGERLARLPKRAVLLGAEMTAPVDRSLPTPGLPGAMEGSTAATSRMLRASGLLGLRLRSIRLAAQCPGTLVNLGQARSTDLAMVIRLVKDRLWRDHGHHLDSRLVMAGRPRKKED